MAFTEDYHKYIKSQQWKLVCQKAYATYGKRCQACGSFRKLQVHHLDYGHFKREPMVDLAILCQTCHRQVHHMHRTNRGISLRVVTRRFIIAKRIKR